MMSTEKVHEYPQQNFQLHAHPDAAAQAEIESLRLRIQQLQQSGMNQESNMTESLEENLSPPSGNFNGRMSLSSPCSELNSEQSSPPMYTPSETAYTPSERSQTPTRSRYQSSSNGDTTHHYRNPWMPEVPSYTIPSRPEIPEYTIPSRPDVPSYTVPSKPEIPSYSVPSRPDIPSYNIPSKPKIPSYTVPSKPAVPSYSVPSRPEIPEYTIPSRPDIPEYTVPRTPEIPSHTVPSRPAIPEYSTPTSLSTSEIPSLPRAPSPSPGILNRDLQKPIAIPATSAKLGSPFLRAYSPSLASYALPPEVFLRFIDDLNRVAVASPPLQVLGLAGSITSFVPLATAQIVGNVVSAAATLGTVAVSKSRTEMYIREANRDIFGPRGLKVEIAKIEALAKIAGMPILSFDGSIDREKKILSDLDAGDIHTISGQQRRLNSLSEWIAPLDVTPLPEIQQQSNPLSRLSQAASERQRKKGESDVLKERKKGQEDASKAEKDYEKEMRKLEKEEAKVMKEDGGKLERELEKIEKERAKVERKLEKDGGKGGKDAVKDDKEEKAMRKILWLIIRNKDADSGSGPDPYTEN